MKPIEIIHSFIEKYLDGDISLLASFQLGNLRNDKNYGCPDRKFDSDDTDLMRAIYCIVFREAWDNLSMENCGDGKLRGDTINSYNTLFSPPWADKFTSKWYPNEELKIRINNFQKIAYTIGNMTILPDKRIGEWSINKHRGCHDSWHDYEDRFLAALYKVLMRQIDCDPDLQELVQQNDEDFAPFYGDKGWKRFIDKNMLEYYVDKNYVPKVTSKGYTYWRGGYTNRERFLAECNRYIEFSTSVITDRAKRMINIIRKELDDY